MKENLRDFLYKQVKYFSVSEAERKELYEYIELLAKNFEGAYSSIEKENTRSLIVKGLEEYIEKSKPNV